MKEKLIVLTTGGSGGHVFPAEAVASYLKAHTKYRLIFITDKRGQKRIKGTLSELPNHFITASSVTGKSLFKKFLAAIQLLWGCFQAIRILIKQRPNLVVGFGGYASIPTVLAAQFLHIPVMLHEQNAILGRANRFLARKTCLIATSFAPTKMIPKTIPIEQTGLPVRQAILEKANAPYPLKDEEFHLLIIGGSQGAHAFSQLLPKALVALSPELKGKLILTQQVRQEDMQQVQEEYRNSGIKHIDLAPFFDNIPELLEKAHLVISRSGASTLAELSKIGRPGLLIPLPTAADDHQTANAQVWTANGAGWILVEKEISPEAITERITQLMENFSTLQQAAKCALTSSLAINADKAIGESIIKLLTRTK